MGWQTEEGGLLHGSRPSPPRTSEPFAVAKRELVRRLAGYSLFWLALYAVDIFTANGSVTGSAERNTGCLFLGVLFAVEAAILSALHAPRRIHVFARNLRRVGVVLVVLTIGAFVWAVVRADRIAGPWWAYLLLPMVLFLFLALAVCPTFSVAAECRSLIASQEAAQAEHLSDAVIHPRKPPALPEH
jgi:hypothetical protein